MQVHIHSSRNDFFEAQKLYWSKTNARFIFLTGGAGLIVISGLEIILDGWSFLSAVFLFIGLVLLFYKHTIVRMLSKIEYIKTPILRHDRTIELTDNVFRIQAEHGKSEIEWSAFVNVHYNDKIVLLYHGPRSMLFIPRSGVSSEIKWKKLLGLIAEKVK